MQSIDEAVTLGFKVLANIACDPGFPPSDRVEAASHLINWEPCSIEGSTWIPEWTELSE